MWKIIFVKCRPVGGQWGVYRDPNAINVQCAAQGFFKHMPEDAGWLACKSQETAVSGYTAF